MKTQSAFWMSLVVAISVQACSKQPTPAGKKTAPPETVTQEQTTAPEQTTAEQAAPTPVPEKSVEEMMLEGLKSQLVGQTWLGVCERTGYLSLWTGNTERVIVDFSADNQLTITQVEYDKENCSGDVLGTAILGAYNYELALAEENNISQVQVYELPILDAEGHLPAQGALKDTWNISIDDSSFSLSSEDTKSLKVIGASFTRQEAPAVEAAPTTETTTP